MEVHHHPVAIGSHTSRRKWTHYFWEFLMLFLAVFCGFLAEYQLEHVIENKREKQYIVSLVRDVEMDIVSLKESFAIRKRYINYYDSLAWLLKHKNKGSVNDIYFFARFAGRSAEFSYHDRTILQLKSSGSLRLIRNKEAADSITIYDNEVIKRILSQQEGEAERRNNILGYHIGKIFDAQVWNEMVDDKAVISRPLGKPDLITDEPKIINEFIVQIVTLKTAYRITNAHIGDAIKQAGNLISHLKKEYHLSERPEKTPSEKSDVDSR